MFTQSHWFIDPHKVVPQLCLLLYNPMKTSSIYHDISTISPSEIRGMCTNLAIERGHQIPRTRIRSGCKDARTLVIDTTRMARDSLPGAMKEWRRQVLNGFNGISWQFNRIYWDSIGFHGSLIGLNRISWQFDDISWDLAINIKMSWDIHGMEININNLIVGFVWKCYVPNNLLFTLWWTNIAMENGHL